MTCQSYFEHFLLDDLLLPGDGHGSCAELAVEVLVPLVQADALHSGELLNVQNVLDKRGVSVAVTGGWASSPWRTRREGQARMGA